MSAARARELTKFLSVGVVNTLVGLFIIYLAKGAFNADDIVANALGYSLGMLVSFTLNSRWTFSYQGAHLPALAKFVLVGLASYSMNLLTVVTAIHYFGLNGYVAQALGIPPYTLTSYLANKYYTFRPIN